MLVLVKFGRTDISSKIVEKFNVKKYVYDCYSEYETSRHKYNTQTLYLMDIASLDDLLEFESVCASLIDKAEYGGLIINFGYYNSAAMYKSKFELSHFVLVDGNLDDLYKSLDETKMSLFVYDDYIE